MAGRHAQPHRLRPSTCAAACAVRRERRRTTGEALPDLEKQLLDGYQLKDSTATASHQGTLHARVRLCCEDLSKGGLPC